mgnify:CR=1 FL=1
MPFPKTWVEELLIEWLHLEGFLVEADLPVCVSQAGGRYEADIIGARIVNDILDIWHLESGSLIGGQKDAALLMKKKFSSKICESVTNYFARRLSFSSNQISYKKYYIPTYSSKPVLQALKDTDVTVEPLLGFISKIILPTVRNWKQNPPHLPKARGKYVTLPDSYWMLKLVDYLDSNNLLNI